MDVEKVVREATIKDVLKLVNGFEGEEYTDFEIWVEMKKELKKRIRKLKWKQY